MRPSTTARRYAEAAFQVAQQDGDMSSWLTDLQAAADLVQESRVASYFRDPATGTQEKLAKLNEVFGHFSPHVLNLLRVLTVSHRLHLLPPVMREFEALEKQARGVLEAEVTVARPMSDGERAEIEQRLNTLTGKHVELQTHVDPRILGGIIIQIGDKLIDASVAGRLQRLRQNLVV